MLDNNQFSNRLISFTGRCPTAYHCGAVLAETLRERGFQQLGESECLKNIAPGKYFILHRHSTLAAFVLGDKPLVQTGLRIGGGHTDSPGLKLKPNPVREKNSYQQLCVEVYGAPLLSTWFDRDLSLAGRVSWLDGQGILQVSLLDWKYPIAVIPSLAIHLDRESNNKKNINKQTELIPLTGMGKGDRKFTDFIGEQLKVEYQEVEISKILNHDLFFYDTQKPCLTGLDKSLIVSGRLDNQLSCFILIDALINADPTESAMVILNDHEEVGSVSTNGARGRFLNLLLARLMPDTQQQNQLINRSLLISMDNAHAVHPNFSDKHDPEHLPVINKGPVIKWNANQRYATDALTGGFFQALCLHSQIPCQDFVMVNDMGCGSTIGPLISAETGIKTVDVGVPTLGMHSIRETAGSSDCEDLRKVLGYFFSIPIDNPLWQGLHKC
jgi:aspartyl aminopeptidase